MFNWYSFFSDKECDRARREVRSYALVNFSGFYRYKFNGQERIFARVGYNCCHPLNPKLSWITLYPIDQAFQPLTLLDDGSPEPFCSISGRFPDLPCEPVDSRSVVN